MAQKRSHSSTVITSDEGTASAQVDLEEHISLETSSMSLAYNWQSKEPALTLGVLPAVNFSYAQNNTSIFHSYLITTNVATKKQKTKTKHLAAGIIQFLQNLL